MFNPDQIKALEAPLSPKHVAERTQAGRRLSYIEGWHAIAEANRIFGFDQWARETLELRVVSEKPRKLNSGKDAFSVSYIARVRVTVGGVVRDGTGAGHGIDADLGLAHESAIKEAETDAMKRALMTFGNPFGLALYDKSQANVYDEPEPRNPAPPSRASSPTAEYPAALGGELTIEATKPPRGIDADLWATVVNRASGGIEALGAYWNNDLTTSEKAVLAAHKEALKAFAANMKRAA